MSGGAPRTAEPGRAHPGLLQPGRLSAPEHSWTTPADVVVVGSGIAGLTAALRVHAALRADPHGPSAAAKVMVVTKDVLDAGSTQWAQGGIAAALGPGDSPADHERDTLVAGAGACDADAVRALVTEGPDAVRELIALGTVFDHHEGELALTREGGHHRDRIAHAGGDATGAEIQRALVAAVEAAPEIEVIQHALALDLLLDDDGGVAGVTLHVIGEGQRDGVGAVLCRAVVLASGGLGQVFSQTTNPAVATGDGMALALRAGAVLRDLEFVQFHPTVMWLGPDSRGQQPLISEAVRGEGAYLVDGLPGEGGARFMQDVHDLADLAPRDVVAKAITRRMTELGRPHVWLDARHLGLPDPVGPGDRAGGEERAAVSPGDRAGGEGRAAVSPGDRAGGEGRAAVSRFWERRFPTILATCRAHGVDPVTEPIPVAPACHYASGGVATDLWGRTSVPGLYATGEVACSGVHGANRLASNSLLEGLVFSRRIAEVLPGELRPWRDPAPDHRLDGLVAGHHRPAVQETMTALAGVLRSAEGLATAAERLGALLAPAEQDDADRPEPGVEAGVEAGVESWETTNLVQLATVLTAAAARREETRGSHWREDFADRDDARWAGHVDARLVDGVLQQEFRPAPATDPEPTEVQR